MNGSGKTGIVTSMDILRNLIVDSGYLNNPMVQKYLDAIINKNTEKLFAEVEYLVNFDKDLFVYKYNIELTKDAMGKYIISHEKLSSKKATSRSVAREIVFEVSNGEVVNIALDSNDEFNKYIIEKSINLLSTSSMSALFFEKILLDLLNANKKYTNSFFVGTCALLAFGKRIHVYLDQSDDHKEFFIHNTVGWNNDFMEENSKVDTILKNLMEMDNDFINVISVYGNLVPKTAYENFERTIKKLQEFISIFKYGLKEIQIEKKEDKDFFVCSLIMVYESYKIHAEFESTGIKKLIKLFAYLTEMVQGGIVFIDEFDSNLHDVYLCALLEYLMEYAKGQLCFTTHNVGPMDVLKRHKMSIDFLSEDNKIYPWKSNGNYSPSKLYRSGMIEGSPFNIDSIDFIGVFDSNVKGVE